MFENICKERTESAGDTDLLRDAKKFLVLGKVTKAEGVLLALYCTIPVVGELRTRVTAELKELRKCELVETIQIVPKQVLQARLRQQAKCALAMKSMPIE